MFSAATCLLASIVNLAPSSPGPVPWTVSQNAGTGTCKYTEVITEKYRRNALTVIASGFGLFGSTRSCKIKRRTHYEYIGPPIRTGVIGISPAGQSTQPVVAEPLQRYVLRFLDGEAECYGDLVRPDSDTDYPVSALRYISIDGRTSELDFTLITGPLTHFLGPGFDASPFDPAYLSHQGWTGFQARIPRSALLAPTLTFSVGGDPSVPILGMMDLVQPDSKVLRVELGAASAFASLSVHVSATDPGDGPLVEVGEVTLPIVADAFTTWFQLSFPGVGGSADANGVAEITFPLLHDTSLEGIDLYVAVLARHPATGEALAASTFAQVQLRDTGICER